MQLCYKWQRLHHKGTERWALYSDNANLVNRGIEYTEAPPRPLVSHHLAVASVAKWHDMSYSQSQVLCLTCEGH